VVVFDMFPSAKVKDLLQIMSPGGDGVDRAGAAVPTQSLPRPSASHGSLSGKVKPVSSCSSTTRQRQH
jgi:jasmonate ZIM domain-containing protein